jgi:hypothetical protein
MVQLAAFGAQDVCIVHRSFAWLRVRDPDLSCLDHAPGELRQFGFGDVAGLENRGPQVPESRWAEAIDPRDEVPWRIAESLSVKRFIVGVGFGRRCDEG